MSSDAALLHRYVDSQDEGAFTELVRRHLPVVYAAAMRRANGRADLAGDAAHQVFCDLARKSPALVRHESLIGWLHQSTRYAVIDALRADIRRRKLLLRASKMADDPSPEPPLDRDHLRPWLDAAMDNLREADRDAVLMRYFYNLSFGQIGARLGVSENTARMRTERSLEKLRGLLARRGVTSTAAALVAALGSEASASAPVSVAASVVHAAVAIGPAHGLGGVVTVLLMSKSMVPIISGVLAAGATALIWTASVKGVSGDELAALRMENERLEAATRPGAAPELAASVADAYVQQAVAIGEKIMEQRQSRRAAATGAFTASSPAPTNDAKGEVTARGHRNHGNATAHDAALTFAWAGDIADPVELAGIITFDADGREAALEVLAGMPDGIRAQYATPESLYGMLLAASCLEGPPPGADWIEKNLTFVELSPDRFATRNPGSDRNVHEYQRTNTGWKYVVPLVGVRGLPSILNSETLAKLATP